MRRRLLANCIKLFAFLTATGFLLTLVYHQELLTSQATPRGKATPGERTPTHRIHVTNSTKVIILSYMRSGSSLLGKLFDTNERALYVFEPLWYLCSRAVPRYEELVYLNGTIRYPDVSCQAVGQLTLESFLTCDIESVDVGTLTSRWQLGKSQKLQKFAACGPKPACVRDLIQTCQQSAIRAAKTIKIRLGDLKPLLVKYPDLRVIHLVRDPRGIIHSRIEIHEYYKLNPLLTAEKICGNMRRDAESFKQFRVFFPGRVLQVRYEDLSADPLGYAEGIYSFMNLTFPDSTRKWIAKNTQSHGGGAFDTSRNGSLTTAYRWRHLISWKVVMGMYEMCKHTYTELLYAGDVSEENLRNKDFPLRMEMCKNSRTVLVCPKH